MSKTRSKQGIQEKWVDRSNVSKTIVNQGTEGSLVYCANGPMNIWKSDFERGMNTYAQKWKTAEIYKRNSAGGLHAENKHHDCGAPPTQGECLSGLNPQILSTNNKVIRATINMLRKENRKKRHTCQQEQVPQVYWSTHEGKFKLPADFPPPGKHQDNMCLSGLAVHHPAYETLEKYTTGGCPVKNGQNFTKEEIHATLMRGPNDSDLIEEEIYHFAAEAKEKMAQNQARLVCYESFKGNLPTNMKVSPIAEIPHKSKAFR